MGIRLSHDHKGQYTIKSTNYGKYHIYNNLEINSVPHKVVVYLPNGYNNKNSPYPVVYMNDGHTAFSWSRQSQWSWNSDVTVDSLISSNCITPLIVVAVYPVDRNYEYLDMKHYFDNDEQFLYKGGGLTEYSNFMAYELKLFIDNNYNTDPYPEKTTIVGSSLGGTAAFHTSCTFPRLFGNAAILSAPFFIYNKSEKITTLSFKNEIEKVLQKSSIKPKLWIDWGKQELYLSDIMPNVIQLLVSKFAFEINKNLFPYEDKYGTHDERAWAYRFELILKKFYSLSYT